VIEIRIDAAAFRESIMRASRELQAGARQALGQSAQMAVEAARSTPLFKDGKSTPHLRETISRVRSGPWAWAIKASAKHALFVEKGTKPHRIEARRRKTLRFVQHGEVRFRRWVWHPGTKPTYFMQISADLAGDSLVEMLERAADRAFR
jgi:hypothetical protein